ncbi:MAG: phosphoribosylglycinamide formyltransferase [Nitrospinae bacterium]|nr:phosphoribosylglycinamide formyltransferase [Nitrospinota bacterium]
MTKAKNVAIFISGRGSNMEALMHNCKDDPLINFCLVFSNNASAQGLEIAQNFGVETKAFNKKEFESADAFDDAIIALLREKEIDLVCLAGYMAIVSAKVIHAFPNKIINIHPSLLPSFPGLNVQQKAIDYGVKVAGCTVHFIDEKVDHGPIITQKSVEVNHNDTQETLTEKILVQEHKIYSEALKLFCHDKLEIIDRIVHVNNI